ncbi:hypothetical protein [Nostoc sp.]
MKQENWKLEIGNWKLGIGHLALGKTVLLAIAGRLARAVSG